MLDVLEAIERIERVSVRGRDHFYEDEMAQVWVIHHLQIIGEAVRGISLEFRTADPDIPWSDIIGMRNEPVFTTISGSTGMRSGTWSRTTSRH